LELLGDVGHVESYFGPFGDSISVGARCTVCAKHTVGSKLVWTHLMLLLGDEAQVEAHFDLIGDSASLDAR
jgi:hypothetical protein